MTTKHILIGSGHYLTVFVPTREDIQGLKVGDMAPDCFGKLVEVVSIHAQNDDLNGKAFVCYYTKFGDNGSSISNAMKEGRIQRSVHLTNLLTSAEIDKAECDLTS